MKGNNRSDKQANRPARTLRKGQTVVGQELPKRFFPQGAERAGGQLERHELFGFFEPDSLGLQVGKLAFFGLHIGVRDFVRHIGALASQVAAAGHAELSGIRDGRLTHMALIAQAQTFAVEGFQVGAKLVPATIACVTFRTGRSP